MKAGQEAWSRLLLWLALVSGLLFTLVTPPFQPPDERAHFLRAFSVSEGRLLLEPRPGGGLNLPESLSKVLYPSMDEIPFHPERKARVRAIREAFAVRLEPDRRAPLPGVAAAYNGVLYLPQAAGIALARLLTDSVLVLFYAGRIASVAACALLFALAVRRAAPARPLFFALSLTPMTVFLMASHSADAVTNSLAFLLLGTVLGLAAGQAPRLGLRETAELGALSILLGLAKPAYMLLPAAAFLIPTSRFGSRARRWAVCGGLVAVSVLAMAGWMAIASRAYWPGPETHPAQQVAWILTDPHGFVATVVKYYWRRLPALANQYVGKLGWVDTQLPVALVTATFAVILFVAATGGSRESSPGVRGKLVLLGVLAASLVWMSLLLYVVFSPVGSTEIYGTQGRYFIPLGPLFFLLLAIRRWRLDWETLRPLLAACAVAWLAVALGATAFRYYV